MGYNTTFELSWECQKDCKYTPVALANKVASYIEGLFQLSRQGRGPSVRLQKPSSG